MSANNIYVLYRQSMNWSEGKLQRHLLARDGEIQDVLPLAAALFNKRLPFFGQTSEPLEDPVSLADFIENNCQTLSSEEKAKLVEIICSIGEQHILEGMDPDYLHIRLLVKTAARICLQMDSKDMNLVRAIAAIESIVNQDLNVGDIYLLAQMDKPGFERLPPPGIVDRYDYYALLKVGREATDEEIKEAHRFLSSKYHPDNSEFGNEVMFSLVSEAFHVLIDKDRRAEYDNWFEERRL